MSIMAELFLVSLKNEAISSDEGTPSLHSDGLSAAVDLSMTRYADLSSEA